MMQRARRPGQLLSSGKTLWPLTFLTLINSGCGSFNQAPLPKSPEQPAAQTSEEASWVTQVREADLVYYCLTRKGQEAGDKAPQIVRVWQESGQQVAVGWSEIPVTQQTLLEQWRAGEISGDQVREQLRPAGTHELLDQVLRPNLRQVALGLPREIALRLRAGERLTPEESAVLPGEDFQATPDSFDNFADRIANSPRLRRYNISHLYRVHLAAEQLAATQIVHFNSENRGARMLVILPDDPMIDAREIAGYVRQKVSLHQVILDQSQTRESSRLLAESHGRRLKVIDSAPVTACDLTGLCSPRL